MRRIPPHVFAFVALLALTGCKLDGSGSSSRSLPPPAPAPAPAACADGVDNDSDGLVDFPGDPGCSSAADTDEVDPTQCNDGIDNDNDGFIDLLDKGCSNSADNDETDPPAIPACSDGLDNDNDGLTDFPADPGCVATGDNSEADPLMTRYDMANSCWVMRANGNGKFVTFDGSSYNASVADRNVAERFYMKPTALGKYMFYNSKRQLMTAGAGAALSNVISANATDNSEWHIRAVSDKVNYPQTPTYNREPTRDEITAWRNFDNNPVLAETFNVTAQSVTRSLAINESGTLITGIPGSSVENESFSFIEMPLESCALFPEAESNFTGTPFKGTQPDGTVLGHADVHVHISSSEFLGGGQWGYAFHKFGIEHALGNCSAQHGSSGHLDLIGGAFTQDFDGHATDGWPTFTDWPKRDNLTHEAIYWKWIERAWAGGLRVIVNDLVDNETLCELQRNAVNDPTRDCNSMNNAGRQAGTMYGMENYIDAQYGGPGKGFFQIVHSPAEAREVIKDGKIAVVLGIEISNLFDCKLNYKPLRQKEPFEEPADGSGMAADGILPIENTYECTTEEGLPNSILTQMERIHGWGVRQIISIHEFDNAFGGNGIFDGLILNLGNRENTGGIPSGDVASIVNLFSGTPDQAGFQNVVSNLPATETATGEWWTTYNCPIEGGTANFSGYLWSGSGGSDQNFPGQFNDGYDAGNPDEGKAFVNMITGAACSPSGQGGRTGGKTPCYPVAVNQCNARWMTPAGLYTYGKMMEMGFIFDWDHMEVAMKTQALELAEAQNPVYPFVSTHGTFGGTTVDQATRALANGGILYPSNGSSSGFRNDMNETLGVYTTAMQNRGGNPLLFGFGYGTDTNGLSAQSGPRNNPANKVVYPFSFYTGAPFSGLSGFSGATPVIFNRPTSTDVNGDFVRSWDEDTDGNAHYGMLADFVQEVVLDGTPDQVKHLFNSAEVFLQAWERTEASSAAIKANGLQLPAKAILRSAPVGDMTVSDQTYK